MPFYYHGAPVFNNKEKDSYKQSFILIFKPWIRETNFKTYKKSFSENALNYKSSDIEPSYEDNHFFLKIKENKKFFIKHELKTLIGVLQWYDDFYKSFFNCLSIKKVLKLKLSKKQKNKLRKWNTVSCYVSRAQADIDFDRTVSLFDVEDFLFWINYTYSDLLKVEEFLISQFESINIKTENYETDNKVFYSTGFVSFLKQKLYNDNIILKSFKDLKVVENEFSLVNEDWIKEKIISFTTVLANKIEVENLDDYKINYKEKKIYLGSNVLNDVFTKYIDSKINPTNSYISEIDKNIKTKEFINKTTFETLKKDFDYNFDIMGLSMDLIYYDFIQKYKNNNYNRIFDNLTTEVNVSNMKKKEEIFYKDTYPKDTKGNFIKWFPIGLGFATGEIQKELKNTLSSRQISLKHTGKLSSIGYVSLTKIDSIKDDKNIYSDFNKLKLVYNYCIENDIEICLDFMKAYNIKLKELN